MTEEDHKSAVTAHLALGSNLGDRLATLRGARLALDGIEGLRVTGSSPLYETSPVGGPEVQGPYYNAVLAVTTTLSAGELLRRCLAVESRFGRRREQPRGPRTLDIDLLTFDRDVLDEPELVVPHPRLHRRRFVLVPLADLAPELSHPLLGKTVQELLAALPETDEVHRILETW